MVGCFRGTDICVMVHIGAKIKDRLYELGMSRVEFARRINKTRNVVYDIFKRESIDTNLLVNISKVLDFNFFEFYSEALQEVKQPETTLGRVADTELQYKLRQTESHLEQVQENNALLKKLNAVLEDQLKGK